MVNYACAVSQSELGKYFEWIKIFIDEWGRVGYEKLCRSRRVLSSEAEGLGGLYPLRSA